MSRRVQRRILVATTAAGAALALSACGISPSASPGGAQPELTKDDVTLTLNWWGADARTQLTLQAIDLFEKEYPNITVEPTYADWTGYWDRLATTTAAGDMPDVSQFDQLYLASYADRGTLLDLSTVSNTLDTSDLAKGLLDTGSVNDTLYAVPTGATPNGVIINTSLFEQYGVELPDTDNWTWDDFDATAEALTEASDGAVHGVSPFGGDSFSLTYWARQHGGTVFDTDGSVSIDADTLSSYWQKALDWIDSGAAPSVEEISEGTGVALEQNATSTGKTGMAFIPAGQFTAYQSAVPDTTFEVADWPTDSDTPDGFQYLKPSMYWAASAKSEHPAESALLIDFLTRNTEVGTLFGTDRGVPANPGFQKAIEADLDAAGQKTLDFTTKITAEVGDAPPITPNGASDIETNLARYFQQVLFEEQTPDTAASEFIKELKASVAAAS